MLIEICTDTLAGVAEAARGGADRIELCAALELGGLTPSPGLIAAAAGVLPVMAMMRPRAGGFVWSEAEIAAILTDIAMARASGAAGVVLGASLPDGRLDAAALRRMAEAARGLDLTLHRAFDLVPDLAEAVELAVALGFRRILTSGRAIRAEDGLADLLETRRIAAGRIAVMPGSGIGAANAGRFAALGFTELHASCSAPAPAEGAVARFGFAGPGARRTRADLVAALVGATR